MLRPSKESFHSHDRTRRDAGWRQVTGGRAKDRGDGAPISAHASLVNAGFGSRRSGKSYLSLFHYRFTNKSLDRFAFA